MLCLEKIHFWRKRVCFSSSVYTKKNCWNLDFQTRIPPFSVQSLQEGVLEFEIFTYDSRMLRVKAFTWRVGDWGLLPRYSPGDKCYQWPEHCYSSGCLAGHLVLEWVSASTGWPPHQHTVTGWVKKTSSDLRLLSQCGCTQKLTRPVHHSTGSPLHVVETIANEETDKPLVAYQYLNLPFAGTIANQQGCHWTFAKITANLRVRAVSQKMNTKRDRKFRKRKMK